MLPTEKTAKSFQIEIEIAKKQQLIWSKYTNKQKLKCIQEIRHLVCLEANNLTAAIQSDISRNPGEVIATDILPTTAALKYLFKNAAKILKPRTATGRPFWLSSCQDTVHRMPHGVVGIIGTWNYPIFLNLVPIAHALAAGNAVLWKPSEYTPNTANAISKIIKASGLPDGLFTMLPATREAGPALLEAEIDFLHFTGSEPVGRAIAKRLGERLIPSVLELSGIDRCVVLHDSDPAFVAKAIWYGMTLNQGQTCMAVRRVDMQQSIYGQVVDELKKIIQTAPAIEQHLVIASQLTLMHQLITEARSKGAEILSAVYHTGHTTLQVDTKNNANDLTKSNANSAKPPQELSAEEMKRTQTIQAAIILNPSEELSMESRAVFAPIAIIRPFNTVDELLKKAENDQFNLVASVFTKDIHQAKEIAMQLKTGQVVVNDVIVPTAHPGTPFGGRKASGWGVTQGNEGLLAMTIPKVVSLRSGTFRPHFDQLATGKDGTAIVQGMLNATHSRTWTARLAGAWQTIKAMMKYGKS